MFGRIDVGNNVFIGINAILLPGIKIGDNSIIGAGAIVTRDVPSNSVVAGVPARVVSTVAEYEQKVGTKALFIRDRSLEEKRAIILSHFPDRDSNLQ